MGWRALRIRLTDVFRLCGQLSMGPSEVLDQSWIRIIWPRVPPPASQSGSDVDRAGLASCGAIAARESVRPRSLEMVGSKSRDRSFFAIDDEDVRHQNSPSDT